MATGACGINCDACRLNLLGICSTCGPGGSEDALKKIAAQQRILGASCPILACAARNEVEYCIRDCERFSCDQFGAGPYPFSQGFLNMQKRRRAEALPDRTPFGDIVKVPVEYWTDLQDRDLDVLCENAGSRICPPDGIRLQFLDEDFLVDWRHRSLCRWNRGLWESIESPLLTLLCLVYLLHAGSEPLSGQMVSVQELRDANFFQGPHELKVRPLLQRFGHDVDGFRKAAERAGGEALALADVAYRVWAFPKVPIYYLLWEGDQEFEPRLSILFDRSIESHLSADAIWGLANLVSNILLLGSLNGKLQRRGNGKSIK